MLLSAAYGGNADILRALLALGLDVDDADQHGFTALMAASSFGHADAVRVLLEAGADRSARGNVGPMRNLTALECARLRKQREVMELLTGSSDTP